MANSEPVQTSAAPAAIGPYSQAIKNGGVVFLSGQIPLDTETMELVEGNIEEQTKQVFKNLSAVCEAAGGILQDAVKLTIYITDLTNFAVVNEIMAEQFDQPFPARATIQVSALPKAAEVEIDAILVI